MDEQTGVDATAADGGQLQCDRSPSGSLRLRLTTEDGYTFEARQSPLTARVSLPGQYLHIKGPMEHKRPQKAMYDLHFGLACDWPENRNETRRARFNNAAWQLIEAAQSMGVGE